MIADVTAEPDLPDFRDADILPVFAAYGVAVIGSRIALPLIVLRLEFRVLCTLCKVIAVCLISMPCRIRIKIRPITFKNECGYYAEIFTVDSTYQNDSRIYSVETYWEVLEMIAEAQKKADQ